MRGPFRIGLTGGVASGKTTVANLFAALGVTVIDTDMLAREVVAPGSPLLSKIVEHFTGILDANGSLDRRVLRERVFADPAERVWLEQLTHPAIRALTDERSNAARGPYVIVAIPLLVETRGAARFDRVLVVDCAPEIQLARLMSRDGATREGAQAVISAQASREARLAVAQDVIHNDAGLEGLRDQVGRLHRQYLEMARSQARSQSEKAGT